MTPFKTAGKSWSDDTVLSIFFFVATSKQAIKWLDVDRSVENDDSRLKNVVCIFSSIKLQPLAVIWCQSILLQGDLEDAQLISLHSWWFIGSFLKIETMLRKQFLNHCYTNSYKCHQLKCSASNCLTCLMCEKNKTYKSVRMLFASW